MCWWAARNQALSIHGSSMSASSDASFDNFRGKFREIAIFTCGRRKLMDKNVSFIIDTAMFNLFLWKAKLKKIYNRSFLIVAKFVDFNLVKKSAFTNSTTRKSGFPEFSLSPTTGLLGISLSSEDNAQTDPPTREMWTAPKGLLWNI